MRMQDIQTRAFRRHEFTFLGLSVLESTKMPKQTAFLTEACAQEEKESTNMRNSPSDLGFD